jgi:hypothetical protein
MQNFGKLYAIMNNEKRLITYITNKIQIYSNGKSEMPLKPIGFNSLIYIYGRDVRKVLRKMVILLR